MVLLCAGCIPARQPVVLAAHEQAAYDHIARTPHLVVLSVERVEPQILVVATRQGSERIRYRIDGSDPEAAPHDMVRRMPTTGYAYHYDRSKPRGGFRAAR